MEPEPLFLAKVEKLGVSGSNSNLKFKEKNDT